MQALAIPPLVSPGLLWSLEGGQEGQELQSTTSSEQKALRNQKLYPNPNSLAQAQQPKGLLTLFSLPPRPIQVFSLACKPDQAENNSQTQIPQTVELCWGYGDKGNMKASNCRAAAGCYYTSGQGEEKQARKDSVPFSGMQKEEICIPGGRV